MTYLVDRLGNPDTIREVFPTWADAEARESELRLSAPRNPVVAWELPDVCGPWVERAVAS